MGASSQTRRGPTWGCIADDFTGATDLASNFVGRGLRTAIFLGVSQPHLITAQPDLDVAVVALKSRTAPADEAVRDSLQALEILRRAGTSRFYFKYCSTFDSTPAGNIGPVIDALLEALGERLTIVVPSFPDGGRTVYMGHLFVGEQLLSDSPMHDHPLTPMRDSNVPRLLRPQTRGDVALIPLAVVREGAAALHHELRRLAVTRVPVAVVVDAVDRADLATIMTAAGHLPLVTGGSGLAQGLPAAGASPREIAVVHGRRVILSGSVSARTREQIACARRTVPARKLDVGALRADTAGEAERAVAWASAEWDRDPDAIPLIYSADSREDVDRSDGVKPTGDLVERALGAIAERLIAEGGVRQMLVAGGETAGRVVQDLGVAALTIGPEISAGVAWSAGQTRQGIPILLALKSGNFGMPDMFVSAWEILGTEA